jgi:hypothetical protein
VTELKQVTKRPQDWEGDYDTLPSEKVMCDWDLSRAFMDRDEAFAAGAFVARREEEARVQEVIEQRDRLALAVVIARLGITDALRFGSLGKHLENAVIDSSWMASTILRDVLGEEEWEFPGPPHGAVAGRSLEELREFVREEEEESAEVGRRHSQELLPSEVSEALSRDRMASAGE